MATRRRGHGWPCARSTDGTGHRLSACDSLESNAIDDAIDFGQSFGPSFGQELRWARTPLTDMDVIMDTFDNVFHLDSSHDGQRVVRN